jgi:hypothetical protein
MITRTTDTRETILQQVADFAFEDKAFLRDTFPSCDSKSKLVDGLKDPSVPMMVLATDRPPRF